MFKNIRVDWRSGLLGAGVGAVTMVVLAAGAAGAMARGLVPVEGMALLAAAILVTAGFLGAMGALLGGGQPADAAVSTLGAFLVLLVLNGVLGDGAVDWVCLLALAGGSGGAVLLRCRRGPKRRRRKR